jgi:hypothetical protein
MSNFYGKSAAFTFTISSNITNANLRTLAVAAGWNQSSAVTATIASGVYVYSTSTGTPALTINGSWPGGVTLVNNGFIMGMGGNGMDKTTIYGNTAVAQPGGNAISLGVNVTITNNSYIGGGGGGGGSYFRDGYAANMCTGGGGAGGGRGGDDVTNLVAIVPGAGGGVGASGGNGNVVGTQSSAGGGGGRVFPGVGGTAKTNTTTVPSCLSGNGGTGGGAGASVIHAQQYTNLRYHAGAGGGGGWGAVGGRLRTQSALAKSFAQGAGGSAGNAGGEATTLTTAIGTAAAGGKCVALNGYTVTWAANGTRYGAIS